MLPAVLTVSVDVPDPLAGGVTEVGLTKQVIPFVPQAPDRVRSTAELNPLDEAIATVEVGDAATPNVVFSVEGFAETEKSPLWLTVSVTLVEWVSEPLVPVTVMV